MASKGGFHQLQWRDRAGISPASLFSSDCSEPPMNDFLVC